MTTAPLQAEQQRVLLVPVARYVVCAKVVFDLRPRVVQEAGPSAACGRIARLITSATKIRSIFLQSGIMFYETATNTCCSSTFKCKALLAGLLNDFGGYHPGGGLCSKNSLLPATERAVQET